MRVLMTCTKMQELDIYRHEFHDLRYIYIGGKRGHYCCVYINHHNNNEKH